MLMSDPERPLDLGEYRGFPMQLHLRRNEGRTVGLYTKVSPEEKEVIDQKMALLGTTNLRAYLRKMAADGYVVQLDMGSVVELVKHLRSISSNVNQIARRRFFVLEVML